MILLLNIMKLSKSTVSRLTGTSIISCAPKENCYHATEDIHSAGIYLASTTLKLMIVETIMCNSCNEPEDILNTSCIIHYLPQFCRQVLLLFPNLQIQQARCWKANAFVQLQNQQMADSYPGSLASEPWLSHEARHRPVVMEAGDAGGDTKGIAFV